MKSRWKHLEISAIESKPLSYSSAEYTWPIWKASAHVKNIDIALNESFRIITRCIRPTKVHKLHTLSGITISNT